MPDDDVFFSRSGDRLTLGEEDHAAATSVTHASSRTDDENPPCSRCGGPHPFDTTVPSVVWNAVVRARGLDEYLCLTCIVEVFGCFGESFTADLIGGPFQGGLPIEVRILGDVATDAAKVSEENTALRVALRDLLNVIAIDELIPESVSYMQQARAAIARAEGR